MDEDFIEKLKDAIASNDLGFIEGNMPYFDVNLRFLDEDNDTPLLYSLSFKDSFAYKLFIKYADLSLVNDFGDNILNCIIYSDDEFRLLELLDYCLPLINTKMKDGSTPLITATLLDNFEMVKILIENGANVNEPDSEFLYPIHIACINGSLKMVELFISKGADLNVKSNMGHLPIALAACKGFDEIVRVMFVKMY